MALRADPALDRALVLEDVDLDHEVLLNDRAPDLVDEDRVPAAPSAPDRDHPRRDDDPARTLAIEAETLADEAALDRDPAPDLDKKEYSGFRAKLFRKKIMQILVK